MQLLLYLVSIVTLSDAKVIIMEKKNILPMPSLECALHVCFSFYYIFNISFPQAKVYAYGLKSSQKLPLSVTLVHDGIEKLVTTIVNLCCLYHLNFLLIGVDHPVLYEFLISIYYYNTPWVPGNYYGAT